MPDTTLPVLPQEVEKAIEEQWSGSDASFLHWTSCASARYEDGTCDCSAREAIMRFTLNVAIVARRHEHCRWRYLDDDTVECRISSPAAPVAPAADSPEEGWNAVVSPHSTTTRDVYPVAPAGEEIEARNRIWHAIAEWRGKWNGEGAPEVDAALDALIAAVRAEALGEV